MTRRTHWLDRELIYLLDPVRRIHEVFDPGFVFDPIQQSIIRSRANRIGVCCSRQWGKTTTVAAKAAAEALDGPGLILVVAPVERQARELFRKIRTYIRRAMPVEVWPEDNKTSLELPNGARIVAVPAKGENIRGYTSPKLIIIDEAAFVADNDYRSIRPMLSHGARLILMSTPFGKRGFFHEAWTHASAEWERYEVKAVDCCHIPAWFLAEERIALGEWWYRQEYECEFLDQIAEYFNMDEVRESLENDIDLLFMVDASGMPDYYGAEIEPLF